MKFFGSGFAALVASMLCLGVSATATAQQTASRADEIPREIPTSSFAARSQMSGARLSPDGSQIAVNIERDGKIYVGVYDAATREMVNGVDLGDPDDFNWFHWAGNNKLLFSVTGTGRREDDRFSRLLAYDMVNRDLQPLVLRRMSYEGDNLIHIDPDGRYVIVSAAQGYGEPSTAWRFDLNGPVGEAPDAVRVESAIPGIVDWITDETGTVRIGVRYEGRGRYSLRYRSGPDDSWDTVSRGRTDQEGAFDHWDFMGLRAGSDLGYSIAIPEGADRRALMRFDFSTGLPVETVHYSEDEDVRGVVLNRSGEPIAVTYSGESTRRDWIDPEIRRWRDALGDALPGSRVTILDITDDRSRMLVLQSGGADPGALYVFTPGTMALDLFSEYRPQVHPSLLSEPQSIRYEARDGTSIHGYLTLPRGREAKDLPLIIRPHGGPYGIRDTDGYNDMVQLLANRGYAVVQPNFRGSGGYGEAFELLGNGQIGRSMQDDLDDAVAHLVEQGIVDPERVCILGSSYGGFAAMWGAIRNPEIYRCAVSFAGVTHFERQLAYDSDFLFGRNRGRWWDRVDGDQINFDLDDVSPAVQVARLTRPLLLVHGEDDDVVPFSQYELMVSRAERAGVDIETLTFEDTGHGFTTPETEQAYYDAILDFLARHNPAD